jgi:hypothetical protein
MGVRRCADEEILARFPFPGGRVVVGWVRRWLSALRSWLMAEKADALCLKADRKERLFVCDAAHRRADSHAAGRERLAVRGLREA